MIVPILWQYVFIDALFKSVSLLLTKFVLFRYYYRYCYYYCGNAFIIQQFPRKHGLTVQWSKKQKATERRGKRKLKKMMKRNRDRRAREREACERTNTQKTNTNDQKHVRFLHFVYHLNLFCFWSDLARLKRSKRECEEVRYEELF